MASAEVDPRLGLVAHLTAACGVEIARRDPAADIPWPTVPTVSAMVAHLGGVHRWVTEIVRTQRAAKARETTELPPEAAGRWFEEGRIALLDALGAVPPETPCWVLGGRVGTVAFWRRRMVFENVKHLMDLRAAGGGRWEAAPELTPEGYADGIDELLTEFLPRTRPGLSPLPGTVVLHGTDTGRSWSIGSDWTIGGGDDTEGRRGEVFARTGDLALVLWERADPLEGGARFRVEGDEEVVAVLRAAPIHPW